jgi:ABC-2 type transport system permease protein
MNRTLAIAKKEWKHILRDPRSLMLLFIYPVLMLFLYGYALNLDIKNIPLGIWDADHSSESRALTTAFEASDYFTFKASLTSTEAVEQALRTGRVKAVLAIPQDFGKKAISGNPPPIGLWIDGSDANTASVVLSYVRAMLATQSSNIQAMPAGVGGMMNSPAANRFTPVSMTMAPPFQIRSKVLYNPELKSTYFIVPGLIAILMMMVCTMLTSVAIVREKETGTFEQLLVSPIRARELIIGKVLPYLGLAFFLATFIMTLSHFYFGVPLQGSLLLLTITLIIYLFCALALGLWISTVAHDQRLAMLMSSMITMLPSMMLSGFMFPIRSMPMWIQLITNIVPAKYFLLIIRGIALKNSGLHELWHQLAVLLGMGIILIIISVQRFRKTMVNA